MLNQGDNMGKIDIDTAFQNGLVDTEWACLNEPPRFDFILPGLKRRSVGAIIAPGGVGKSFLALELCVEVSTQFKANLLDLPMPNSPSYDDDRLLNSMYITREDEPEVIAKRMHSIHKLVKPELRKRLYAGVFMQSFYGIAADPYLIDKNGDKNIEWINAFKSGLSYMDICFIDTLSLFHSGVENDNDSMKLVIEVFKQIAKESDTAIMLIHHANKQSVLTGKNDEQQASRGASALTDNIRCQYNLRTMTKEEEEEVYDEPCRKRWVYFTNSKVNYDEAADADSSIWFYRDPENEGVLIRKTPEKQKFHESGRAGRNEASY